MTTTIQPTRQAVRLHRSHLATTHRAPLVNRASSAGRTRATAFTPMARDPRAAEAPRPHSDPDES
jgi:hypothetical protein